jgi:thymidylate synthase ThyX
MSKHAEVFAFVDANNRLFSPAVQASVLAKYSRSPLSARALLESMTEEEAQSFQHKWGVKYGHSSVAELAVIPFCFEGVSILATKELERWQRGAYSEKSTRYQKFSTDSFVRPEGLPDNLMFAVERLYEVYHTATVRLLLIVASKMGKSPEDATVKARVFDNTRYYLPAGTGTNVACLWNTRDARYVMNDLLGSLNPEFRALGAKMQVAAEAVAPVFGMGVKASIQERLVYRLRSNIQFSATTGPRKHEVWPVALGLYTEKNVIAEMENMVVGGWNSIERWMDTRGKTRVPDILRIARMGFDTLMDYGAFRDIQRHRRCEQYVAPLTPFYGYAPPPDDFDADMAHEYRTVMNMVFQSVRAALVEGLDPELAQYVLPLATMHASRYDMDLQEVYYLTELRTQPQGHISYRRVAWDKAQVTRGLYPTLMRWCQAVEPNEIGVHV